MPTLGDLQSQLRQIDAAFPSAKLEGLAFKLDKNESLGLNDGKPFHVNIPFRTWPKVGDPLPNTQYPSALQEAFKDVLAAGFKKDDGTQDNSVCFIDIVSLTLHELFFVEDEGGWGTPPNPQVHSISKAIADAVNSVDPNVVPVIRILSGADENYGIRGSEHAYRFEKMFWNETTKEPLITHPKAKLYVGYYGPTFHPGSPDAQSWLSTLGAQLDTMAQKNEELIKSFHPAFDAKKLRLSDHIADFIKKDLPAISWNHGKLLVVNGRVIMTGGGNYWNEYRGDAHNICDHQVKIKGDTAVTGHNYANYFFKYLNKIGNTPSDTRSGLRSLNLADKYPPKWSDTDVQAPIATFELSGKGRFPVLTVGRLGDWHGSMKKIPFPVQVVDAIRDIALNLIWHLSPASDQGKAVATADLATRDLDDNILDKLAKSFKGIPDTQKIFGDLQVNPVAWASRYCRKYAIENATKRVYLTQQMLVDRLQLRNDAYKNAVFGTPGEKGLNAMVKHMAAPNSQDWDGAIWGYDLLCAIGWALSSISIHNGDGVYIVVTTNSPAERKVKDPQTGEERTIHGKQPGYEDETSVAELKRRLAICMKGMASLNTSAGVQKAIPWFYNMIDANKVDGVIAKHLKVKRIIKNDGDNYNHCKVVMVDDGLLYVGSDNAYPCYNEEHGVWIDDASTIKTWKRDYWDGLWAWSTEATD